MGAVIAAGAVVSSSDSNCAATPLPRLFVHAVVGRAGGVMDISRGRRWRRLKRRRDGHEHTGFQMPSPSLHESVSPGQWGRSRRQQNGRIAVLARPRAEREKSAGTAQGAAKGDPVFGLSWTSALSVSPVEWASMEIPCPKRPSDHSASRNCMNSQSRQLRHGPIVGPWHALAPCLVGHSAGQLPRP